MKTGTHTPLVNDIGIISISQYFCRLRQNEQCVYVLDWFPSNDLIYALTVSAERSNHLFICLHKLIERHALESQGLNCNNYHLWLPQRSCCKVHAIHLWSWLNYGASLPVSEQYIIQKDAHWLVLSSRGNLLSTRLNSYFTHTSQNTRQKKK